MGKIGIVTVLYNSAKVLEDFFVTLNQQSYRNFVLYVVDNASADNSLASAEQWSKQVDFETILLPQPENWGVAKGNNIGIEAALADRCDYVLLSNNDIVLKPDTIQQLLDGMRQMGASMAVPKIYFHDTGLIWCAGGKFAYFKGGTPHRGYKQPDNGQFDKPEYTAYAPTCFMLIEADVFKRVGRMDERYFVYFDDSDFVWRALKRGTEKLAYIPTSTLRHKESSCTGGNRSDFSLYYHYRNRRYFCLKNMRFPQRQVTLLWATIHTILRKPFLFNQQQLRLIKKATQEGEQMYRSR